MITLNKNSLGHMKLYLKRRDKHTHYFNTNASGQYTSPSSFTICIYTVKKLKCIYD
jgi:hypothetical protein